MGKPQTITIKSPFVKIKDYLSDDSNAIALKAATFFYYSAAASVVPFFVLQMQQLGINIKQIALIFLLVPIAALLGPIVFGLIVDKIGKVGVIVASTMGVSIVIFDLILLVPAIENQYISVICSVDEPHIIELPLCYDCFEGEIRKNMTTSDCYTDIDDGNMLTENSTSAILTGMLSEDDKRSCTKPELVSVYTDNVTISHIKDCDFNYTVVCKLIEIDSCQMPYTKSEITTVVSFFLLMFVGNFFAAAAMTTLDATLIAAAMKYNIEIGKQKLFAMLAFGVMPLLAGLMIDYHSKMTGVQTYSSIYILASACSGVSLLIMAFTGITIHKNEGNMLKQFLILIKRPEVDIFLLLCLILGTNFGFIEAYLFIYLKDLGAPSYLLGFTMTVGFGASVPMLYYAELIEKKFGRLKIYVICFLCYSIRMFGYSFMVNPFVSLAFEVFEAITNQLMWITCLGLCPILAPKGMLATLTGMAGATHYSIGKGIGGFLGGFFIDKFGIQGAFRAYGCLSIIYAILYLIVHKLYLGKMFDKREKELLEREEMERKIHFETFGTNEATHTISVEKQFDIDRSAPALNSIPLPTKYIVKTKTSHARESVSVYDNLTDVRNETKEKDLLCPKNINPNMQHLSKSEGHIALIEK